MFLFCSFFVFHCDQHSSQCCEDQCGPEPCGAAVACLRYILICAGCVLPRIRRLIPAVSGGAVIRVPRLVSVIRIFRVISVIWISRFVSIIWILGFVSAVVDFLKRICGCPERAGSFVDEALLIFRKILCQKLLCLRESISQRLYAFFRILIDRIRAEKFPGCLPSALQKHFSVI